MAIATRVPSEQVATLKDPAHGSSTGVGHKARTVNAEGRDRWASLTRLARPKTRVHKGHRLILRPIVDATGADTPCDCRAPRPTGGTHAPAGGPPPLASNLA